MKALQKNISQTNKINRFDQNPRETYSPLIEESKTLDKYKNFYTPSNQQKDQKMESTHGSYLKSKYSLKPNTFDERLNAIASTFNEKNGQKRVSSRMKTHNKENEDPAKTTKFATEVDNKKILKISSLFERERFEQVEHEFIVQNWFHLHLIFDSIYFQRVLPIEVVSVLSAYNLKMVDRFTSSFTNYNEVRSRLHMHFKLEFWCLIVLSLFREHPGISFEKISSCTENLLQYLLKSCYYVSLIIVKAVKYGCLSINSQPLDEFSKRVQKYNFETGIPLIKTLKINNDACLNILKQTFLN
jgi:hypothetical protein